MLMSTYSEDLLIEERQAHPLTDEERDKLKA
jgi:hypothetical protein